MTSKIVVNNIEADSGISTVTFNSKVASSEFVGSVTGNLTGTASTATAAATAYGLSGTPTLSGITSVSTTNLTVNGNAYPNAGPLSNRNLIINGAMQVAQRGTTSTATGYATVDRFTVSRNGVSVTQSQESLSSGDPYDEGFRYFLRYTNTTTNSSAQSFVEISQYIESQNVAQSGWNYKSSSSYITTSFWVRSSLAGTYYIHYNNDDVDKFVHNKAFTLSANTWTKVTHSIPGDSSCVFNDDTGRGLRVVIVPHYGTDYTDSSSQTDAWFTRTTSNYSPDFAQNWSNSASATFDITGLQLEVGSVATPFEHRSYGDDLHRCQRYYQKIPVRTYSWCGYCFSTTDARTAIPLITTMRSTGQTIDTTNTPRFCTTDGSGTGTIVLSSTSLDAITVQSDGATGLGGAGSVSAMRASAGATAYIGVESEL